MKEASALEVVGDENKYAEIGEAVNVAEAAGDAASKECAAPWEKTAVGFCWHLEWIDGPGSRRATVG